MVAALGFSLMSLFARLVGPRVPSAEIVLVRSLLTLAITRALLQRSGLTDWRGTDRKMLVARGLVGFCALSCFFYAVTHMPLAEATVIHFTNPIFTALLAPIFLGERATGRLWLAVGMGFLGMILITRPAVLFAGGRFGVMASDLPPMAVLAGLAAALMSSGAYIMLRRLTAKEHELVIVLYVSMVAIPLSLITAAPVWVWPGAWDWLLLAAVAVAGQTGQVYITRGLKHVKAAPAGTILYLQIVFATFWGLLVLGEWPDAWTVVGALLVLGGSALAARRSG